MACLSNLSNLYMFVHISRGYYFPFSRDVLSPFVQSCVHSTVVGQGSIALNPLRVLSSFDRALAAASCSRRLLLAFLGHRDFLQF